MYFIRKTPGKNDVTHLLNFNTWMRYLRVLQYMLLCTLTAFDEFLSSNWQPATKPASPVQMQSWWELVSTCWPSSTLCMHTIMNSRYYELVTSHYETYNCSVHPFRVQTITFLVRTCTYKIFSEQEARNDNQVDTIICDLIKHIFITFIDENSEGSGGVERFRLRAARSS